jgi:surface polysaccharide O-acyltransferase-like enzyme
VQRNSALDGLKLIMAIMVVCIHGLGLPGSQPSSDVVIVLKDYLFRIAVPVFFIVNGFFLSSKVKDLSTFKPWLMRVAILYAFWAALYLPILIQERMAAGDSLRQLLFQTGFNLFIGYHHLWYVVALLLAGTLLFVLREAPPRVMTALCICLYGLGCGLQYVSAYLPEAHPFAITVSTAHMDRNGLAFGLPMLYIGVLIRRQQLLSLEHRSDSAIKAGLGLVAIGTVMAVIEIALNLHFHNRENMDLLLFTPVLCTGLFLIALNLNLPFETSRLSKLPSVIYFIHPVFVEHLFAALEQPYGIIASIAACVAIAPVVIGLDKHIFGKRSLSVL